MKPFGAPAAQLVFRPLNPFWLTNAPIRIAPMKRALLLTATLANPLVLPAFSQQFGPADMRQMSWQGDDLGDVGRGFAGDVDQDGFLDLVYQDGTSFGVCLNLANYDAKQPQMRSQAIEDLTLGVDGTPITVGQALQTWTYVPDLAGLSQFEPSPVEIGTSAWSDALRVIAVDFGGGTGLVGLDGDGSTVLFRADLGPSTQTQSIALPETLLDLVPYKGAAGVWKVLAISANQVYLIEPALGTYSNPTGFPLPMQDAVLATFQQTYGGPDRVVALLQLDSSPLQFLHVWDEVNGFEAAVPLGDAGAHAIATGDVDGDGEDDLLLSARNAPGGGLQPVQYLNQSTSAGTAPTFANSNRSFVDIGSTGPVPAEQMASCVLADFSNDGDLDLAIHCAADETVNLVHNTTVDHRSLRVSFAFEGDSSGDHTDSELYYNPNTDELDVLLDLENHFPGATGVELRLWRGYEMTDGSGQVWVMGSTELVMHPLGLGTQVLSFGPTTTSVNFLMNDLAALDPDSEVLLMDIVPVVQDSSEQILERGPLASYCIAFNNEAQQAIESLPGSNGQVQFKVEVELPTGRAPIGGVSNNDNPPPADDNVDLPPIPDPSGN